MTDDIDRMLRYDSLAEAEKITGKDYKEDEATGWLGLAMHIDHNERKRAALQASDDSYRSMPYEEYLRLATDLGFRLVFEDTGKYRDGEKATTQHRHVFWRNGVLLQTESFSWGASEVLTVNSAKIWYNWLINPEDFGRRTKFMSSGGWSEFSVPGSDRNDILVGSHSVDEGLRHTLASLDAHGTFLDPWVKAPHLWLQTYWDQEPKDEPWADKLARYDANTKAVIDQFPEGVREAIGWMPSVR